jgi:hypothetical protein
MSPVTFQFIQLQNNMSVAHDIIFASTIDPVSKLHWEMYSWRSSALNGVSTYFDLSVKTAKNFCTTWSTSVFLEHNTASLIQCAE